MTKFLIDFRLKEYNNDNILYFSPIEFSREKFINFLLTNKLIQFINDKFYWIVNNFIIFINLNNILKYNDYDDFYKTVYELNKISTNNDYNNKIIIIHKKNLKIYKINNKIIFHTNLMKNMIKYKFFMEIIKPFIFKNINNIVDSENFIFLLFNIMIHQIVNNNGLIDIETLRQSFYDNLLINNVKQNDNIIENNLMIMDL
jgi:hypothetical protein